MIGCSIGTPIGCPGRRQAAPGEGTGEVSFSFAVTAASAAQWRGLGEIDPAFSTSVNGVSEPSTRRTITDTVTYLQEPVDYALAGDQDQKRRRAGQPGQMTKAMLRKIFRE